MWQEPEMRKIKDSLFGYFKEKKLIHWRNANAITEILAKIDQGLGKVGKSLVKEMLGDLEAI